MAANKTGDECVELRQYRATCEGASVAEPGQVDRDTGTPRGGKVAQDGPPRISRISEPMKHHNRWIGAGHKHFTSRVADVIGTSFRDHRGPNEPRSRTPQPDICPTGCAAQVSRGSAKFPLASRASSGLVRFVMPE